MATFQHFSEQDSFSKLTRCATRIGPPKSRPRAWGTVAQTYPEIFKNKSCISFQLSDGCKNNPDECGPGHCVPQACPDPAEYLAGRLEPSKQSYQGAEAKFVCNPGYVMAQQKVTSVEVECKAMPGGILVMHSP